MMSYFVVSISSFMAAPPGPIIEPESSLEIKNLMEIKFLVICRADILELMRGDNDDPLETFSLLSLEGLSNFSFIFLLTNMFLLASGPLLWFPVSILFNAIIESRDIFMYSPILPMWSEGPQMPRLTFVGSTATSLLHMSVELKDGWVILTILSYYLSSHHSSPSTK